MRYVFYQIVKGSFSSIFKSLDSWKGSRGHISGNCYILGLFGEDKTLCQYVSLQCNGMKVCIFLPKHLLESYEHYEADMACNPFGNQSFMQTRKKPDLFTV
jgi:hypothetical protein